MVLNPQEADRCHAANQLVPGREIKKCTGVDTTFVGGRGELVSLSWLTNVQQQQRYLVVQTGNFIPAVVK